jgi:hypothetical protein
LFFCPGKDSYDVANSRRQLNSDGDTDGYHDAYTDSNSGRDTDSHQNPDANKNNSGD